MRFLWSKSYYATISPTEFMQGSPSNSLEPLGPDELGPRPLIMIPSEDLCPTGAQRELFANNLKRNKTGNFTSRVPLISSLLRNSFFAAEYVVGSQGPLVYDGDNW